VTDHVIYGTDDMALAGFLMCGGAELEGLESIGGGMFKFRLKCAPNLVNAPHQFWSGQARVEPMRFAQALKRLKGEVARRGEAERRGRG
jgi:hypothetical protein